ncbi:hypothetical protein [Massilia sp.]|uniref:hypothetical protein n=1 Tax=Massilia sp. TaxID=1882437 RepID=UPI00352E7897
MNKIDQLKQLRLEEESRLIDAEFVEQCARVVLTDLVSWSNRHVFSKLGGELSIEIPLGAPNAGVKYASIDPPKPVVVIYLSMITDIYRDALTFPSISQRLVGETDTLTALHEEPPWNKLPFAFPSSVPELQPGLVHGDLSPACEMLAARHEERKQSKLDANDVRCRFIMFELMLAWTFFHELGHVLQRHYRLRTTAANQDHADVFLEWPESDETEDSADTGTTEPVQGDLPAQARELMADAEAMDLTLKYMHASGRLCFATLYLLYCSVSCMYQRFYQKYEENLNITKHRHPHPALREQVSEAFLSWSMSDYLVARKLVPDREHAALVVTYITVRANLFVGLFRATRIEARDESSGLPSYMRLQTEAHRADMLRYQDTLMPYIESQMAQVQQWHLLASNRMDEWLEMLKAHQRGRTGGGDASAAT